MSKSKKYLFHKVRKKTSSKIGANLIAIFFIFFIFLFLLQIDGYKFTVDKIIINSIAFMISKPDLSYEQKSAVKNGKDFQYLDFIKTKTPENSTILMPSEDMIFPKGRAHIFNKGSAWGIKNKAWSQYYLYPRKLIYVDELTPSQMQQFDYVAIVNSFGYEYLNYTPRKRVRIGIMPREIK